MRTINYTTHGVKSYKLFNSNDLRAIKTMIKPLTSATKVCDIRYLAAYYPETLASRCNQRGVTTLRAVNRQVALHNANWLHNAIRGAHTLGYSYLLKGGAK
jgi:hypothetical protein